MPNRPAIWACLPRAPISRTITGIDFSRIITDCLYPNAGLLRLPTKLRRAALFLFAAGLFLQAQIPHYGKRRPDAADDKALTFSFAGVIRQMDDKSMDLEAVD